tara:strand:+ start:1934 stop:2974 length:1041 start_codon:yes stop_codon:yes gene_type:complete
MNGKENTMMENVYDGYRAAEVTEMLAQLSKPDADNGHGKELRNFNALPNNVYYVTEASPMLQRSDPSTWAGVVDNHRADEKVFAFLSLVAKKFPRLTFCLQMGSSTGDAGEHYAWFRNLYVHADGEVVGEMHTETEWGKQDVVMHFSNNRINAARKHGGSMKTTKIDRGKSIIAKYFYGLTTIEAITYKAKVVIQQATSGQYQMQTKRNQSKQRIIDFVRDQLTANDANFIESMEHLVGNQQGSSPVALYKSCVDDLTLMDTVCKAQKRGEGLFVSINEAGEEYHTWKKDTTTVKKYVRHELPSKVLGALGMLKIAEDNSFISGTGYKYERGYYWIAEEIANELGC